MRWWRRCRESCFADIAALVSLLCSGLFGATPPLDRTTFDSNTNTYAQLTNSLREVKQRLEVAEKKFGSSNTNTANLLSDLAGIYDDLGDCAEAAALDQRCLAIREEVLGPEHMDVADVLNDLAFEYREIGDYDRALPLFQRSLAITKRLVGEEHFDYATTLTTMADVYRLKGDCTHALPLARRALEIREKVLGKEHPDLADSFYALAAIQRELGDFGAALALCQQGIAIAERHLGRSTRWFPRIWLSLVKFIVTLEIIQGPCLPTAGRFQLMKEARVLNIPT
jgi:tetratricopeptide (TPR) repeat protein